MTINDQDYSSSTRFIIDNTIINGQAIPYNYPFSFTAHPDQYEALLHILEQPPQDNLGLQKLLSKESLIEKLPCSFVGKLPKDCLIEGFDCGYTIENNMFRKFCIRGPYQGWVRQFIVNRYKQVIGLCKHTPYRKIIEKPERVNGDKEPINNNYYIPVALLESLVVDISHQSIGIGTGLLRDCIYRVLATSNITGVRMTIAIPYSYPQTQFLKKFGFIPSPVINNYEWLAYGQWILPIKDVRHALAFSKSG